MKLVTWKCLVEVVCAKAGNRRTVSFRNAVQKRK